VSALRAVQRLAAALFGPGDLTIRSHGAYVASYEIGRVAEVSGRGSSWEAAVEALETELVHQARGRGDLAGLVAEVEKAWEAA
jgi:hypothetical protein